MRWSNRPLAISPIDSPTSLIGWANQLATKNIATATASTVTTTSTAIKPIDRRATCTSGFSRRPSATRPTRLFWNVIGASKPSTASPAAT